MEQWPLFYALMRLESGISTYDWLVEQYEEEKATHETSIDRDTTQAVMSSGQSGNTKTPATTKTTSKTTTLLHGKVQARTDDTQTQSQYSNTSSGATGSGAISANVSKNSPMSISMSGYNGGANAVDAQNTSLSQQAAIAGELNYASTLATGSQNAQTKTTGSNSGTDTTTNTGTVTTRDSGTDTETQSTTVTDGGTITDSATRSDQSNAVGGMTETGSTTDLRVKTGRYTRMASLLRDAADFIATTDAWEFLKSKIEPCFMGIYDV